MTDPIADMLTRIRNAQAARLSVTTIPFSKVKKAIADILSKEGYISTVEVKEEFPPVMVVGLKYVDKQPVIKSIERKSKPGHRLYRKADEIPFVLNDYGIAILSTSQGMMTNKEARKKKIGGEIICSVY